MPLSAVASSTSLNTPESRHAARAVARAFLQKTLGFADCLPSTLDALVEGGRLRMLDKDEHLVRQGDRFDMLALVVEGSLSFSQTRPDGQSLLLGMQCAGDTIGFVPVVDGSPYPFNTFARCSGTLLLIMPGELIRRLRPSDPALGRGFELQLAFRIRLAYEKMNRDAGQTINVRLAHTLLVWAQRYGLVRGETVLIKEKFSQDELSGILGASRQRVNFALCELKKAGLIATRYSKLTVLDMAGLSRYANEGKL